MRQAKFLCVLLTLLVVPAAHSADYLSPELRQKVDQLIEDVNSQPTNASNVRQRAGVFWDWANAWSMDGRYLPVNLTPAVAAVLGFPGPIRPARHRALDGYILELALLDAEPDAIGEIKASGGPFEVTTHATLTQTYTTGTRDIEIGGGFLVARHFMAGYFFQTNDPTAPNYVTASSSNSQVELVVDSFPMSGMHGGFRGSQGALVFRVAGGSLTQGDQVTFVYGDTSQGSPGLRFGDIATDYLPFPVYVALNEQNHFLSLPIQKVETLGTSLAGVHAFAPSVVKAGESFEISIRSRDHFFNRPKDPSPAWVLNLINESGESMEWETTASDEVINYVNIEDGLEAGVYQISVISKDGAISGYGNAILVEDEPTRYIYWGDTHGHSGFAEGLGLPDRFMRWAKEDARLDFVSHSEHDIWMDDYEWQVLIDNVERHSDDDFIAFLGYEWTRNKALGGHHNVLFRDTEGRERVPAQVFGSLSRLYHGLRNHHDPQDVVVIPHAHQPGNYRLTDPELEPLVEIMSQHGTFEWFGQKYLEHGHEVGFTAASDNHIGQPGYQGPKAGGLSQRGGLGALIAPEKTRDSLFDAMKNINAYATSGDRIILDFDVNGTTMGQRMPMTEERNINGRVVAAWPIAEIAVIKNGEEIWKQDYLTSQESNPSSTATFKLSFHSSSVHHHPHDNPRGWRSWIGSLEFKGADLVSAQEHDFANTQSQSLNVDEDGKVVFSTLTRGDSSSIDFTLTNIQANASVTVSLQGGREYGGGPPTLRTHQPFEASEFTLGLSAADGQISQHAIPAIDYVDEVRIRQIVTDGQRHVRFNLTDTGQKQGDYYYARVTLTNDAQGWTSPVWVGGYPTL